MPSRRIGPRRTFVRGCFSACGWLAVWRMGLRGSALSIPVREKREAGKQRGVLGCRDMRREGRVLPSGRIGSRPAPAGGRFSRRRSVCDFAGGGRCGARSRPRWGKAGEGPACGLAGGNCGEAPLPSPTGERGRMAEDRGPQTAPRRRGRERDCLIGSSHRPTPASGSSSSPAAALWPTAAPGAGGRAGRCAKKRL